MKTLANILTTLAVVTSIIFSSQAQTRFSERVGGTKGSDFMIPSTRQAVLSVEAITGIAVQHNNRRVERIVVEYANRENENMTESRGNSAGDWSYFQLEEGEYIVYITGRAGTLIDQVTFHTSMRRTFGPYGGSGGQEFEISIPSNAVVIGFTGKTGPSIKQIGLIYRVMNERSRNPENSNQGVQNQRVNGSGTTTTQVCPARVEVNRTGGFIPIINSEISNNDTSNQNSVGSIKKIASRNNRNPGPGKKIEMASKLIYKNRGFSRGELSRHR